MDMEDTVVTVDMEDIREDMAMVDHMVATDIGEGISIFISFIFIEQFMSRNMMHVFLYQVRWRWLRRFRRWLLVKSTVLYRDHEVSRSRYSLSQVSRSLIALL